MQTSAGSPPSQAGDQNMMVDSWDRFEDFAFELERSRKAGREPPKAESTDVHSWGPIPERLRPLVEQVFAKRRDTERDLQLDDLNFQGKLREILEELSKPKSKTLAGQYGIPDATP
jgi:hypothetical protein